MFFSEHSTQHVYNGRIIVLLKMYYYCILKNSCVLLTHADAVTIMQIFNQKKYININTLIFLMQNNLEYLTELHVFEEDGDVLALSKRSTIIYFSIISLCFYYKHRVSIGKLLIFSKNSTSIICLFFIFDPCRIPFLYIC